jgi:predicted dehydrogenase
MDYFKQSFGFRLQKVLRYCRLYGPTRTYVKVLGQKHKRRRFVTFPVVRQPRAEQTVGLIGCGNYAFSNIAYFLSRRYPEVIGACMDCDIHRAASLSQRYKVPIYTSDVADVMRNDGIGLVYIASNHASHAEYAIEALDCGKDVYIEKPHVVDEDQLVRLASAIERNRGRFYLGFNRPFSRFGRQIRQYVERESGRAMYNWFIAGHAIDPDHWYFHPREGGRVLGNLCHWTDFLFTLTPEPKFPVRINPTRSDASDVDIAVTYTFGDGSIGAITFSAKGHTFEGVKERFSAHRGNLLLRMEDFHSMTAEVVDRKRQYRSLFRDHGHETNIITAYENSRRGLAFDRGQRFSHLIETARLFLKTKQALEENREIVLEPYEPLQGSDASRRISA